MSSKTSQIQSSFGKNPNHVLNADEEKTFLLRGAAEGCRSASPTAQNVGAHSAGEHSPTAHCWGQYLQLGERSVVRAPPPGPMSPQPCCALPVPGSVH